jgi:hypothetical protein
MSPAQRFGRQGLAEEDRRQVVLQRLRSAGPGRRTLRKMITTVRSSGKRAMNCTPGADSMCGAKIVSSVARFTSFSSDEAA